MAAARRAKPLAPSRVSTDVVTVARQIPAGAKCVTPKAACAKFSRGKSWLWDRVKNDPEFPRPLYTAPGAPLFLEHELDAYVAKLAAARA